MKAACATRAKEIVMRLLSWLVSMWFRTLCRLGFHRFEYSIDPMISSPNNAQVQCQHCGAKRPECVVSTRQAVDAYIHSNDRAERDPEYKRRWSSFKIGD